jgi:hypothetical protein
MMPFPSTRARFVDATGTILQPFIQYLQQFVQAPPPFINIVVGASPFSYQSKEPGNVTITGGVVTKIELIRGSVSIDLTGSKFIPVSVLDIVKVTYTVLPTLKLIPAYGQSPK